MKKDNLYGLHGKLVAQAGQAEQLADILLQAAALMQSASGCRLYAVSRDGQAADEVWITELWESETDHAASLQVPGVRELIQQAIPILAEPPQKGQELRVLGGWGI